MSRDALAGLHGVPGPRRQEIYTPKVILDAIAKFWPDGIALDPCSGPDSIVESDARLFESDNGLAHPWPARTYVNPPYRYLKDWMLHADQFDEWIMLCPVRTNRTWWREVGYRSFICWLDPVKFVGYDQVFPAPLCLMYRGDRNAEFVICFDHLGGWF